MAVAYDGGGKTAMPKLSPRTRKILLSTLLVLVVAYAGFGAYIWWAMHQTPEKFGHVMSKMPGPLVFLLFPFETFWTQARAGQLNVGDPAPDFALQKLDSGEKIQLSALHQQQPVVLVFGSYT